MPRSTSAVATSSSIDVFDLTRSELIEVIRGWGFSAASAARLWRYVYRDTATSIEDMTDLPPRMRSWLAGEARLQLPRAAAVANSADGLTRKWLLRLDDGREIETVRMRYRDRTTACLSTQAGCALGCVFCATGQRGFDRNLTPGEIVAQAMLVQRSLVAEVGRIFNPSGTECNSVLQASGPPERLRNIVLMGMGEPLLNYDAAMRAIDILRDASGLAIADKRITLSTVGVIPGIVRLTDEGRPCSLAVSLHAATQAERELLVPAATTWPLDELIEACRYYTRTLDRRIFFEWTLIDGQNDAPEQAEALASLVAGLPAHINLIPLNRTAGYHGQPTLSQAAARFQAILRERGLPVTLRQRRGLDIAAGCGQLAGTTSDAATS
jgi:23S rRNA (adenine2503-C2)-methyltransferase